MGCCLHGSFAEVAAQDGAQVAKHRLAADDEHPGIHDGVKGIESEGGQILLVVFERIKGVDEASNLKSEKKKRLESCLEVQKKRHF